MSQKHVFEALGIDQSRLSDRSTRQLMMVIFERWHLSPTYDIQWMAATQDRTPPMNPDRGVYGVTIIKRRIQNA
jgi:hypothetical protein